MNNQTRVLMIVCCSLFVSFPAIGQTIVKTPEQGARALFAAWRTKNKTRARAVAGDETVGKLFSVRHRPMRFKGCSKREEGDFECLYEDGKNDLTLAMLTTNVSRRGYRIRSVSFSSEAF